MPSAENSVSFFATSDSSPERISFGYSPPERSGGKSKSHPASRLQSHHKTARAKTARARWHIPVQETNQLISESHQALLIGAVDYYSVGDLLMPHVVSRLLNLSYLRCAGLVSSDFTDDGGHLVRNFGECAVEMVGRDLQLIHIGGETLSRSLTSGYSIAANGEEAERFSSLSQIGGSAELTQFVRRRTGQVDDFAYVLAPSGQFFGARSCFHAVGLSDPHSLNDSMRLRLVEILKSADFVGVRDENGASFLEDQGVKVERMPCGLSVLPLVCKRPLQQAHESTLMKSVRNRFPNGWIAVETGRIPTGDFDAMVAALGSVAERERIGIIFYEGGHERGVRSSGPDVEKWVSAFRENKAMNFGSRNIWEVASLLLHSRLYCGGGLHSRIIAMSAGIPRINVPTGLSLTKSYCKLWEHDAVPVELTRADGNWAGQLHDAIRIDPIVLRQHSLQLQEKYFASFDKLCLETGMKAKLVVPGRRDIAVPHFHANQQGKQITDEWIAEEENCRVFQRIARHRRWVEKGSGRVMVKRALQRTFGRK